MGRQDTFIVFNETQTRIKLEYPVFIKNIDTSKFQEVLDDSDFIEQYATKEQQDFLRNAPLQSLELGQIKQLLEFLVVVYDIPQILKHDLYAEMINQSKHEFDKQFSENQPLNRKLNNPFPISPPYNEKYQDLTVIDYYAKDFSLFTDVCQKAFAIQYKNYIYYKPDKLDEVIHQYVIDLTTLYDLSRFRSNIFISVLPKTKAIINQQIQGAANSLFGMLNNGSMFKYQELVLKALYYCSLCLKPDQAQEVLDEYKHIIKTYLDIATTIYEYMNFKNIHHKARISSTKPDNKVYEYVQYRVYHYLLDHDLISKMATYHGETGQKTEAVTESIKQIDPIALDLDKLSTKITKHILENEYFFEICIIRGSALGNSYQDFAQYKKFLPTNKKHTSSGKTFETIKKAVHFYLKLMFYYHVPIEISKHDSENIQNITDKLQ